jgi:L-aminopeptidase/D-esterase-like protein
VAEERWRDIAGPVGSIEPGRRNAITDVPGVRVGHSQAESGERTGVTVVAPPSLPPPAGAATVNGMGELREYLDVFGNTLGPGPDGSTPYGSCIAVCATDAPMSPHELRRLALRPLLGLARAGSYAADSSGEIGVAFTTSTGQDMSDVDMNPYFAAAYEAAHESVFNCLVAARPAERRDGEMQEAFPIETVRRLARARDAAPAD